MYFSTTTNAHFLLRILNSQKRNRFLIICKTLPRCINLLSARVDMRGSFHQSCHNRISNFLQTLYLQITCWSLSSGKSADDDQQHVMVAHEQTHILITNLYKPQIIRWLKMYKLWGSWSRTINKFECKYNHIKGLMDFTYRPFVCVVTNYISVL